MFELYNLFKIDGRNCGNGTHSILLLPPGFRHNFPRMFDHQRGTRIGPFSSENYRFQDNFLSSPSHAWNMRGPFGRSVFCVHTASGFSADAHCYRYPLNTSMPKHRTTILCFCSTYFLLIPQTIDDVEHSTASDGQFLDGFSSKLPPNVVYLQSFTVGYFYLLQPGIY